MSIKQAGQYFAQNKEIVSWWNPEADIMAPIYQHGLDLVVRQLRQYPNIRSVLDAACGRGRVTKILRQFYQVTAVDISEAMLNQVRKLNLSKIRIVRSDLIQTPFLDNEFDAIVCLETLVHLADLKGVFHEFYRILRPGGILLVDFDNKYGLIRLTKDLFHFLFKIVDREYKTEREKRERIFRTLSPLQVIHILRKVGFKIKKQFYVGVITPFVIKNKMIISPKIFKYFSWLNRILEKTPLIKFFSTYIYIVCQK